MKNYATYFRRTTINNIFRGITMKKRIMLITTLAVCMFIFLTACSNQIDKSMIIKDIEPDVSKILSSNKKIDDIEILEYNTDDTKETSISLKLKSSDEVAEYIDYFIATYYCSYDDKWIFDNVSQVDKDKSTATPIKGVNEEIIISSLNGEHITINDEKWDIKSNNIKNLSIESQNTNIDERKDNVTVTLTLDDDVLEAEGKININYIFDKKWEATTVSNEGEFKTTEKNECELKITDNDLISEIAKKEITLFGDTSNRQTVSMAESEISNFEVYKEISERRGTDRRYYCKGTLTKPNTIIEFETQVYYIYEGRWLLQPTTIKAELDSVNIEGEWNGTYNGVGSNKGKSSLKITDVTEDGKIKGVYSYTPNKIDQYSKAGSYNVSGTIDMSNLLIKLTEDDTENVFTDISAILYIEESEIKGVGQEGCPFVVKK